MDLNLFDFSLPNNLIANYPEDKRDNSRLLVADMSLKNGELVDSIFHKLTDFISPNDILVFNNSKVIPARLFGKRDNVSIEVLLHKEVSEGLWNVFAKPAKRLSIGDIFYITKDFYAKVIKKFNTGQVQLEFNVKSQEFYNKLDEFGKMPIPPYINRLDDLKFSDKERYQTIYAENKGSVAAPTAGLHFSEELMQNINNANISVAFLTLHVGGGTFLPVRTNNINDHIMHVEEYSISKTSADKINSVKEKGGRVIAVGTTSMRALEAACDHEGFIRPVKRKETDIFITPGYKFKIVDALITNFHLPKSTLFILVSSFMGLSKMNSIYSHAIRNKYRFFSYGDTSLLIA